MVLSSRMLKYLVGAVVCGFLVSLTTGIIENSPQASVIGARYYGYPLVWRITMTLQPDKIDLPTFTMNASFWVIISLGALILLEKVKPRTDR